MGRHTGAAFDDMEAHLSGDMHACVIVRNKERNLFCRNDIRVDDYYARFGSGAGHIEEQLFGKVFQRFGSKENIPHNLVIIFAARWSPCKDCIERTIPRCLEELELQKKDIRVKFRFQRYYTRSNWMAAHDGATANYLWEDEITAQAAYDSLSSLRKYGVYQWTDEWYDIETRVHAVRVTSRLVFAKATKGDKSKTSVIETQII